MVPCGSVSRQVVSPVVRAVRAGRGRRRPGVGSEVYQVLGLTLLRLSVTHTLSVTLTRTVRPTVRGTPVAPGVQAVVASVGPRVLRRLPPGPRVSLCLLETVRRSEVGVDLRDVAVPGPLVEDGLDVGTVPHQVTDDRDDAVVVVVGTDDTRHVAVEIFLEGRGRRHGHSLVAVTVHPSVLTGSSTTTTHAHDPPGVPSERHPFSTSVVRRKCKRLLLQVFSETPT